MLPDARSLSGPPGRSTQWRERNRKSHTERVLCAPERSRPCPACASSPPSGSCCSTSARCCRWRRPRSTTRLKPILDCGAQGVDLFFILSGFVLTWNYSTGWASRGRRAPPCTSCGCGWPGCGRCTWSPCTSPRCGSSSRSTSDTFRRRGRRTLTAISYLRQLFLVQLWFQPFFDGSSWDGPAWSISAEWLAYLLFGLLVLVVFRVARATRARSLLLLAVRGHAAAADAAGGRRVSSTRRGVGCRASSCSSPRARWPAPRCAGCGPSDRAAAAPAYLVGRPVAVIVGALYCFDAHPLPTVFDGCGLVDVLFVPLVVTLSIGAGTLPALLSTRVAGLRRPDLVRAVHGARVGAHRLDLGHGAVPVRAGADASGQADRSSA